uniref:cupin domain-containing protein n=1 Tax=Streptomyces violaceus TaxID=1936 RepID=UPI003570FFA7
MHGSAWITPQGGGPVRIGSGDVAVLCGGAPCVVADDPPTPGPCPPWPRRPACPGRTSPGASPPWPACRP